MGSIRNDSNNIDAEITESISKIQNIKMPDDMKQRIIRNCRNEEVNRTMDTNRIKKNTNTRFITFVRKPAVIAAALALVLTLSGVTALAATGKLSGLFKDKTNIVGTVTGTTYEQATDELTVNVVENAGQLTVTVTANDPTMAPYVYTDEIAIEEYSIIDQNGNTVINGNISDKKQFIDGSASITIPTDKLTAGTYKLVINSFISYKKADQPLSIRGSWIESFTIEK